MAADYRKIVSGFLIYLLLSIFRNVLVLIVQRGVWELSNQADSIIQRLNRTQQLLINGKWQYSSNQQISEVINPSTGEIITNASVATSDDVNQAVAAARESFDRGDWLNKTPSQRGKILWKVADLLEEYGDEVATLEMLNAGKKFSSARHGEIPFAADCFRYFAGWCTKVEGSTKTLSIIPGQDFHAYTQREAIGVAALIVPWNGPLVQAVWKIAPALAAGCSCIIKPAIETPLSTVRLAEIMIEAGVPDGVFNVILGDGATAGKCLTEHPDVDKVSFTGSTGVGKQILEAAKGNLKKVSLELGGKSAMIIFPDADLEEASQGAVDAIFSHAGQVCVAGSRLFIHQSVFDEVIEKIKTKTLAIKVGPCHDESTDMGPVISKRQFDSVSQYINIGLIEGGKLLTGGVPKDISDGYYISPTIFVDVSPEMRIVKEEIFGPVLVVQSFNNESDINSMANDSEYGLAASIWTKDISKAHKTASAMRAGLVWVNCHGIPDMSVPFGGYKQSGWGRENGYEALLQYTELKSVVVKL